MFYLRTEIVITQPKRVNLADDLLQRCPPRALQVSRDRVITPLFTVPPRAHLYLWGVTMSLSNVPPASRTYNVVYPRATGCLLERNLIRRLLSHQE